MISDVDTRSDGSDSKRVRVHQATEEINKRLWWFVRNPCHWGCVMQQHQLVCCAWTGRVLDILCSCSVHVKQFLLGGCTLHNDENISVGSKAPWGCCTEAAAVNLSQQNKWCCLWAWGYSGIQWRSCGLFRFLLWQHVLASLFVSTLKKTARVVFACTKSRLFWHLW